VVCLLTSPFSTLYGILELMIGRVRIAKNADTNIYAAMKVIDKAAPERETVCSIATATSKEEDKCEKVKHSIEREVVIMKLIQHPNVIQLYDVYEDSENM
jgi:serine/threonine-protein kinase HSL1 (negative regulator of Swe1 kinase)